MKFSFLLCCLLSLSSLASEKFNDYSTISAFTENDSVRMVVEISAGTNRKFEYDKLRNEFLIEKNDGVERVVKFLPYPGNYGFIPSTFMAEDRGGDGDALDVLLISESLGTGTVAEIVPIGVLMLRDSGEIDTKIIAVPLDQTLRIIDVMSFDDLKENYAPVMEIIELWFSNYKGEGLIEPLGWKDEVAAKEEIYRWLLDL